MNLWSMRFVFIEYQSTRIMMDSRTKYQNSCTHYKAVSCGKFSLGIAMDKLLMLY